MKSEIVTKDGAVYHLGLRPDQLAHQIILVGDPARAETVAAFFDRIEHRCSHREYVTITGSYQAMPISVIGTGMSTDNIEVALMEIYTLFGFDLETKMRQQSMPRVTIIRVGTSGGVQPEIPAGTLAISKYALGLDSTGLYFESAAVDDTVLKLEKSCAEILTAITPKNYRFHGKLFPYGSKASEWVHDALCKIAEQENAHFISGVTATTPGFYGPSARKIEGVKNTVDDIKLQLATLNVDQLQVVNMEMESSLLFHLGRILGFHCGTICPIISGPRSSDHVIDYGEAILQSIRIALQVLYDSRTLRIS